MAVDKSIPFPQADDFNKIVNLINIVDETKLYDKSFIKVLFDNISDRQIDYYLNAAKYLGIIDSNNCFTGEGKYIRKLNPYLQRVELIRLLLSDNVIGRAYLSGKLMDIKLSLDDIKSLIYEEYPDYSAEIYNRRGQTVMKWIDWIDEQFNSCLL